MSLLKNTLLMLLPSPFADVESRTTWSWRLWIVLFQSASAASATSPHVLAPLLSAAEVPSCSCSVTFPFGHRLAKTEKLEAVTAPAAISDAVAKRTRLVTAGAPAGEAPCRSLSEIRRARALAPA